MAKGKKKSKSGNVGFKTKAQIDGVVTLVPMSTSPTQGNSNQWSRTPYKTQNAMGQNIESYNINYPTGGKAGRRYGPQSQNAFRRSEMAKIRLLRKYGRATPDDEARYASFVKPAEAAAGNAASAASAKMEQVAEDVGMDAAEEVIGDLRIL
jgi:hypothetical protein